MSCFRPIFRTVILKVLDHQAGVSNESCSFSRSKWVLNEASLVPLCHAGTQLGPSCKLCFTIFRHRSMHSPPCTYAYHPVLQHSTHVTYSCSPCNTQGHYTWRCNTVAKPVGRLSSGVRPAGILALHVTAHCFASTTAATALMV